MIEVHSEIDSYLSLKMSKLIMSIPLRSSKVTLDIKEECNSFNNY